MAYEPAWYAVLRQGHGPFGREDDAGPDFLEVSVAEDDVGAATIALLFRVVPVPDGGYAVEGDGSRAGVIMTRIEAIAEASRLALEAADRGHTALVNVWIPDGSTQDLLRIDPRPSLTVRLDLHSLAPAPPSDHRP